MSVLQSQPRLFHRALLLTGVLIAHFFLLYAVMQQMTPPVIQKTPQTALQGVVIMPVALPNKAPQKTSIKPVPPKAVALPKAEAIRQPLPVLAAAPKAITLNKPSVEQTTAAIAEPKMAAPATTPDAPALAKAEPSPVEPELILPRSDASGLNNPSPPYPNMSRRLAEQGKVLLEVLILANGTVGDIKIKQSSGYKRLDDAALQAVKHWQFLPAKRGNQPIDYWYVQPISFSLNS